MSDAVSLRTQTHIREELHPSPPLKAVLDGFLEHPSTDDIHLYTQAKRVVPTETFRGGEYQEYVRSADERLRRLGHRTLAIASDVNVYADEAGVTLLFGIGEEDHGSFTEMTAALDEIEWERASPSGLYLRFAKSTLAKEAERRRAAARDLLRHLRHPSAGREIWVGSPHIVSRDIPI